MDVLAHHPCPLAPGQRLTCWQLGSFTLEARWQEPLQLLAVRITADHDNLPAKSSGQPGNDLHDCDKTSMPTALLAWISCEKASSELALDDPLQAELAMAIMALKAESLRMAGFQDARPAGGDNVTPLHAPAYSMK